MPNKRCFFTLVLILIFFARVWQTFGQIAPSQRAPIAPKAIPKRAVAIITFENLSDYPSNGWVGASFAESLTSKLSQLESLDLYERRQLNRVLTTSGLDQKKVSEENWEKAEQVGQTLHLKGVQSLLIGSVSMAGSYENPDTPMLVNARTVQVETGEVTKGEAFSVQGKFSQLFDLQTLLAQQFVAALGVKPTSEEEQRMQERETESLAAYRLYILGLQALDAGKYAEAKQLFYEAYKPRNFPAAREGFAIASEREIEEKEKTGIRDMSSRAAYAKVAEADASQGAIGIYYLGRQRLFDGRYDESLKHYRTFLDYTQNKVVRWKVETGTQSPWWSPTIWEGKVYVGADNAMHAFDAETGTRLWSSDKFDYHISQPVVSEGTVFFSLGNFRGAGKRYGALIALDAQTGTLRWQFQQSDPFGIGSVPTVAGDTVYVYSRRSPQTAEDNNRLYAVNRHNGQLLWKAEIGWHRITYPFKSPFAVFDDVVYLRQIFSRFDGTPREGFIKSAALLALDAQNGGVLWQFNLPIPTEEAKRRLRDNWRIGFPSVSKEVVTIGWDNVFYVLERKTGKLLWKQKGAPIPADDILADELIYLGAKAYEAKTGKLRWKTKEETSVFAVADGIVFARSWEGDIRRVYALESQTGALRWQYHPKDCHVWHALVAEGTVYFSMISGDQRQLHALSEKSGELLWTFDFTGIGGRYGKTLLLDARDGIVSVSIGNALYALAGGERGRVTPSDLDAQIAIGRALRLKGELKGAQVVFQRVVDAKPNLPEAWVELATVFEALGNAHQTAKSWNSVIQYASPLDARYQIAMERLKERAGLLWRYETDYSFTLSDKHRILFSIRKGILCLRGSYGYFYAFDAQRGELLWKSVDRNSYMMKADAVYYVDAGEKDDKLHALSLKNGTPIWESKRLPKGFYQLREVSEGVVLTGRGKVLGAFSAEDGKTLWETSLEGVPSSVLIEGGLVYLVESEPDEKDSQYSKRLIVSALEPQTGESVWEYTTESLEFPFYFAMNNFLSLFAYDGVIYLLAEPSEKQRGGVISGGRYHILYAFEGKTGQLLWKYEAEFAFRLWRSPPIVVRDGIIYGRHALNAKTGERIWVVPAIDFQSIQIASGILYGYDNPDLSYGFSARSAKSGEHLWRFQPSSEGELYSQTLSDGILYIGGQGGFYALDAKTGVPIWACETGVGAAALRVSDGVLYVLSSDGAISAFDIEKAASLLKPLIRIKEELDGTPFCKARRHLKMSKWN